MRRARDIGVPTIVTLAAMATLAALTADAAARQARPVPTTAATAPREAGEPIMSASVTMAGTAQRRVATVDSAVINRFTMPCPG